MSRAASIEPAASSMPRLAARLDAIAPFHVMEIGRRVEALRRAGRSIIDLSIGQPDFAAPQAVQDALVAGLAAGATRYTAALGTRALREAIAAHYGRVQGVDVDAQRIVVTAGASGALLLACCALIDPGAGVLLTDPGYPCNRNFITAFGGVPQAVPVGPATRYQLDAQGVQRHWQSDTRGVLLATPSNPTGGAVPQDEMGRILAAVRERGGFAIVDEIYLGLQYDGTPRSALAHGQDMVVVGSFSKFFAMTGWRLGWLVVPPDWVGAFEKLSQNLFICASSLAQHAALACFTAESMAIFEARRAAFRARRDRVVPALQQLGFGVPVQPDGAFYVYLDCSAFTRDSAAFAARMLEEAGVALVPGLDFGQHEPERHLRLSYAASMEELDEALARLGDWLPGVRRGP